MPLTKTTAAAFRNAGLSLREDIPLLKRTWWRAGGPADGFIGVSTVSEAQALQRIAHDTQTPVFVLGNASNLLVSDHGIRGVVVRLEGELAQVQSSEDAAPTLTLGAGLKMIRLVSRMPKMGWTGLEFMAGIPGTIGGAITMNAGTALGETVDALSRVEWVLPTGDVETVPVSRLNMRYRHAELPPGALITRAWFKTTGADLDQSAKHIEEHLAYRARTQPVDVPTCGSTFRNPPGDTAGRLIDAAGLKGHRIGAAEVSQKHANFVVNTGGASAADIRALVEFVRDEVQRQTGIRLQREVHFVGEWER